MGMFDDLRCDAPLPDGYVGDFQTKDFHCEMDKYRITEEGRLEVLRFEHVQDGVHGDEEPEFLRGFPKWRRENERWERVEYHGLVNFYDYDDEGLAPLDPHEESRWHEYDAKFTDGVLVEITQRLPVSQ